MKAKSTKLVVTTLLTVLLTAPVWAQQEKAEIKVRIETLEDGKKKVFEKTYTSKEEMREDKELQEMGAVTDEDHFFESMVFSRSKDGESKHVTIDIDTQAPGEKYKVRKVIKDKHGEESIIEKEYNSKEEMEEDEEMEIKIVKKGAGEEWSGEDEDIRIIIEKDALEKDIEISKKITVEIEEEDPGKKKKKKKVKVIKKKEDSNR